MLGYTEPTMHDVEKIFQLDLAEIQQKVLMWGIKSDVGSTLEPIIFSGLTHLFESTDFPFLFLRGLSLDQCKLTFLFLLLISQPGVKQHPYDFKHKISEIKVYLVINDQNNTRGIPV